MPLRWTIPSRAVIMAQRYPDSFDGIFSLRRCSPIVRLSEMPSPGPANRALARTVNEAHEVFAHALVIFAGISYGKKARQRPSTRCVPVKTDESA